MSTALKPPIVPESISLDLRRSDRIVRSAEGGSFQREVREGQARWIADVTWPPLHGDDRRELDAWLAMIDRGDRWALIEWPFNGNGSSEFLENKVPNGDFTENINSWNALTSTSIRHIARRIEVIGTSLDVEAIAEADVTLNSQRNYVFRATAFTGLNENAAQFGLNLVGSGSVEFISSVYVISDFENFDHVHRATAGEGGTYRVQLRIGTTGPAGRSIFFDTIQVIAGCRVSGSGQTGNQLIIADGPNDIIARAGDCVEIFTEGDPIAGGRAQKSELKRLTSDVHGAGGTNTHLMRFEPALRESPPQNGVVIFHRPRFKAIMTNENRQTRYTQPDYVQVTRRFEEDILA